LFFSIAAVLPALVMPGLAVPIINGNEAVVNQRVGLQATFDKVKILQVKKLKLRKVLH